MIQPLDLFFNRQWKVYVKAFHDRALREDNEIALSQRDNIIKLTALIHNQLSAPCYKNMIAYAWHVGGYTDDHPGSFLTVKNIAFSFNEPSCSFFDCQSGPFIQCSHCQVTLCFNHFFVSFHFH